MKLICVGRLKEQYIAEGAADFTQRISAFTRLDIVEVKDEKILDKTDKIKDTEGERVLNQIKQSDFVIALDERGREFDSHQFADILKKNQESNIVFVIGGALGLGDNVSKRANLSLALSKMTFPHQMARLLLLEQIYRAFTILKGKEYHK